MLKIGLTGNIGSGKTLVSMVFSTMGIPVFHADEESKKFLDDPMVKNEILKHFGYGILTNDHKVNTRSLATIVFTDGNALKLLNSILHPRVMRDFHLWAELNSGQHYVIQEAAIILESGFKSEYDYIIHVSCPKETAIDRVIKRDRIDGNSVLRRMQFQLDDAEKSRLSDFVILNDGSQMVIPQVLSIHRQLLAIESGRDNDVATGVLESGT
jgi:dephospho-CoA kinase